MSVYAKQQGVKKTICKVNRTDLLKVEDDTDLDSVITPRRLIEEMNLLKNLIVAFIIRHEESLFPGGKDFILPGDRVVVVTTQNNLQDIDDILA